MFSSLAYLQFFKAQAKVSIDPFDLVLLCSASLVYVFFYHVNYGGKIWLHLSGSYLAVKIFFFLYFIPSSEDAQTTNLR